MLTVVEKVLFLQSIEVLESVPTRDLAHVAVIAREETYPKGTVLFTEGEPGDALYFVVEGKVSLDHAGRPLHTAGRNEAFGTWALLDEEPAVVTARALTDVFALRIDREEFLDLLPDHVEITKGVLRSMSKRIRSLLKTPEALGEMGGGR